MILFITDLDELLFNILMVFDSGWVEGMLTKKMNSFEALMNKNTTLQAKMTTMSENMEIMQCNMLELQMKMNKILEIETPSSAPQDAPAVNLKSDASCLGKPVANMEDDVDPLSILSHPSNHLEMKSENLG